jgi:hypothetical protein
MTMGGRAGGSWWPPERSPRRRSSAGSCVPPSSMSAMDGSSGRGTCTGSANRGDQPAVSVHVYRPELRRMTRYRLEGGQLRVADVVEAGVAW